MKVLAVVQEYFVIRINVQQTICNGKQLPSLNALPEVEEPA